MIDAKETIPIRQAAREVGRRRQYVRDLIDGGFLTAYRRGGSDDEPRLEVYLSDLHAAIQRHDRYVPKSKAAPKRPVKSNRRNGTLHPAAMRMRKLCGTHD